jgi:hypothetical protein
MPRKKTIKVIIDTNLFISFLIGKRLTGLKQTLINSTVQLIFSEQNIEELKIVTGRPKFEKYFDKNDVKDLIELIYAIEKIIKEPEICRDPKDNFLLALSDKGKADYLVTGDSDLLTLREFKNTKITTIDQFEKIIKESTNA